MMQNHFLFAPAGVKDIHSAVTSIVEQIPALTNRSRILRIILFGPSETNQEYVAHKAEVESSLKVLFPNHMPIWSYIAQPPFETQLSAEIWWDESSSWSLDDRYCDGVHYLVMESDGAKRVLVGGLNALDKGRIYDQTKAVCDIMSDILERESMPIDSIVRQWNYIERITFEDDDNQHYQEFNDARSELYSRCEWKDGYPAATGIGALSGGVTIDFDAVVGQLVIPVDNKLQVAAHAYSKDVLLGEKSQKTTPKFERAKLAGDMLYISGTAAIRGEESLVGVSAAEQTRITLENIDELLREGECGRARSLRVYTKYPEDFEQIRDVVEEYAPYDALYIFADICRDELLVEIEAVAYKG
ncbi:MAG: Rid family hydrolase [Rikenellaceae bacterium]